MNAFTANVLNMAVIVAGSLTGNTVKKHVRNDVLFHGVVAGIGVVTVFIGAAGLSVDTNALALLAAFSLGCLIGYALDLEGKLDSVAGQVVLVFRVV